MDEDEVEWEPSDDGCSICLSLEGHHDQPPAPPHEGCNCSMTPTGGRD